jgi:hypothetical protein
MYISLPVVLYVLGIILLVILIILSIRLLKAMNNINKIIEDVDVKVKSLNGIFQIIDFTTDKLSVVTDRITDVISNFLLRIFKKKESEEKENE